MAENLKIFKQWAADSLGSKLHEEDLSYYREDEPAWSEILGESFLHVTAIEYDGAKLVAEITLPKKDYRFGQADAEEGGDASGDIANAMLVFQTLQHLTPQQAADERVWLYLTHCKLWNYARARWPLPADAEDLKRQVRLHYHVPNTNRSLVRDNAISRLWWMGYVANRSNLGLENTLQILLYRSDVRANLLERPSLAASEEIFNGVMQLLSESYDDDRRMFARGEFRERMKTLNRIGGKRMLNALGQVNVYRFAKENSG